MLGGAALLGAALIVGNILGCGAQELSGPAAAPRPAQCRSLDQMAPALQTALRGGKVERLRALVERHQLLGEPSDGVPSPLQTLVQLTLRTLTAMGEDAPEAGAPEGQLCNDLAPPAPSAANRSCEARRIIDTFVHEGKGLEALRLLDPLLAGVIGYVVGTPGAPPHYELATALSATCTKAYCRTEDLLGLLIGVFAWLEPTEAEPRRGPEALGKLNAVFSHPGIREALALVEANMTAEDLVVFGNLLVDNLLALPTDPARFPLAYHRGIEIAVNDLLSSLGIGREEPKYRELRLALDELLGPHEKVDESQPHGALRPLLYDLLDPSRPQPVLGPLQKVLDCVRRNDPSSSLMRMVFDLGFKDGVVGLGEIFAALDGLVRMDERASLVTFGRLTLEMLREDEEGIAASRKLGALLLDTQPPEGGGASNAELLLPVAAELFEEGAVGEILCVLDTLLFGCAGGSQPACPEPALP